MQCRGSRRAFTTAGEESGFMPGYGMKRGSRIVLFLVAHALRRSQFSPSESLLRPSLRDSAFSLRFPVENFRMVKFSTGKTLRKRRDGRKRDSEGENCDRRSACATRKRTVREPLFMPYPGMRPLSSPAVVKALLLPLHCICGLFCPYPRPPVLPALSLGETAYRNRRRGTDFSGYGGTFRKKEWKTGYYLAV